MTGIHAAVAAAGGDYVQLTGGTALQSQGAGTASATYSLTAAGLEEIVRSVFGTQLSRTFFRPSTNLANYEVRATLVSGALTSGTTGTFQALGVTRSWNVSVSAPGSANAVLTIEIRRIGTTTILATATVDITAERV